MSPVLKRQSRKSRLAGLAVSVALNAAVVGCLVYGTRSHLQVPEAPGEVTMVVLPSPEPPRPPTAPPQKPARPQRPLQRQTRADAAPQAAAAAPLDSAPQATGTVVPPSYFGALEALIRNSLVYPPGSIARGEEGICKVRVSFSRDGSIRGTQLAQDSGHAALDGECSEVFRRIGRFPPVPPDTNPGATDFSLELPITYSLQ